MTELVEKKIEEILGCRFCQYNLYDDTCRECSLRKIAEEMFEWTKKQVINEAANWINEYITSYVDVDHGYVDDPQEIILSKYCIDTFKEDMEKII